ncbi:MAG: hypothetical protein WCC30_08350, partial [Candidatus Dormiibacterota bacterium]
SLTCREPGPMPSRLGEPVASAKQKPWTDTSQSHGLASAAQQRPKKPLLNEFEPAGEQRVDSNPGPSV